mgnify:CR=1 FL=1
MQQVSKQLIKGLPRRIALMLLDCGLIVLCYWLAVMLRFDSGDAYRRVEILRAMAPMLLYVLPIYMIVFWFGGLYEIMWEYAGMRDLARQPMANGSVIRILDDCASYVIIADEPVNPTSELPSHLSVHNNLISKGSNYKASLHTHPIELVALTHNKKFMEKDYASNLLWSMIPETKAFCPRGLGMVPYKLPSSVELAEATINELDDYDVVMWEKHGVFAVDTDIMAAFDQVDVLNKSALIYIAAKNMGFEPDGMSQEQMKEMSVAFHLPK